MMPTSTKVLVLREAARRDGGQPTYHSVVLERRLLDTTLRSHEILVQVSAVAFNHRDLWIRKGLYPLIDFGVVMGSDAVGRVVASGSHGDSLANKRVFILPMRGWKEDPEAPESPFGVTGGVRFPENSGVFAEYVKVGREHVIEAPEHLLDVEAAAWPLAGVTAWRAVSVNASVQKGSSVLITGIGGGVALVAMQLCLAKGANVYVSSSNEEKIKRAIELGAAGGVNYKSDTWPNDLADLLDRDGAQLSAIIDSGGNDLFKKVGNLLKNGGKLVCYGMTAEPKVTFTMREVMRNQRLLGSTMGSHKDLLDATNFIKKHRVKPIVSTVLNGLDDYEKGFEMMSRGDQFGKIVMKVHREISSNL